MCYTLHVFVRYDNNIIFNLLRLLFRVYQIPTYSFKRVLVFSYCLGKLKYYASGKFTLIVKLHYTYPPQSQIIIVVYMYTCVAVVDSTSRENYIYGIRVFAQNTHLVKYNKNSFITCILL